MKTGQSLMLMFNVHLEMSLLTCVLSIQTMILSVLLMILKKGLILGIGGMRNEPYQCSGARSYPERSKRSARQGLHDQGTVYHERCVGIASRGIHRSRNLQSAGKST